MPSIGFLGFGNMAKAIYLGVKSSFPNQIIHAYDIDYEKCKNLPKVKFCQTIDELCSASDIIFICVKPNIVSQVCKEIKINDKAFVSIAAGITQKYLTNILPKGSRIARIMPNTPLTVNKGMVCIQSPNTLHEAEENFIIEVFTKVGKIIKVSEDKMDAVTGISGSGPAYVYFFIEAMIKSAIENGFTREYAKELVVQTFEGACEMLLKTGKTPRELIEEVCSPNGTTLAAVNILEKNNICGIIENAIEAAIKRSEEISESI